MESINFFVILRLGFTAGLASSISEKGILEPILVRRVGDSFVIISGERRFRAAKRVDLKQIPSIILNADDLGTLEIALIENIQRKDLTPFEEADGFSTLLNRFNVTHDDIAKKISDIVKEQWKDEDYRDAHSGENHQQYDSVELICEFCGEKYTVQSYRKDISRFCSVECMNKNRSIEFVGENGANWQGGKIIIICEICGIESEVDPNQKGITRFCSRKCLSIWMGER